jgi:hypothetical protein
MTPAPDGKVKILDCGLAKAWAAEAAAGRAPEISHSPAMTRQRAEAGMILGTAACMPARAGSRPE